MCLCFQDMLIPRHADRELRFVLYLVTHCQPTNHFYRQRRPLHTAAAPQDNTAAGHDSQDTGSSDSESSGSDTESDDSYQYLPRPVTVVRSQQGPPGTQPEPRNISEDGEETGLLVRKCRLPSAALGPKSSSLLVQWVHKEDDFTHLELPGNNIGLAGKQSLLGDNITIAH